MKDSVQYGKISIIMGIYNCSSTLAEALESIVAQTYTNWNIILCDDGSVDNTYSIAENYRDRFPEKIILLKNDQNMGLNYTLNRCLNMADGEFIARMDGDDLSLPDRFEKEIAALDKHPEIAIVSTAMTYFDELGEWGRNSVIPFPKPEDFIVGTPFCHGPCLVRREAYEAVGGYTYDKKFLRVEDYDLWVKMYVAGYRGMNLLEPLYRMRDDRDAIARRKYKYRINEFRVRCMAIRKMNLPQIGIFYALRPLIVGLCPQMIYKYMHKKRLSITRKDI